MPCYTNQTATVEFGKNTDLDLMAEALRSLGYQGVLRLKTGVVFTFGTFDKPTGKLSYNESAVDIAAVKRSYSEAIITQTAKRNGWQLSWTVNKSGNRQAEVIRASR